MIKLINLNSRRALSSSWSKAVSMMLILEGITILFALISFLTYGMLSFDGLLRDLRFPPPEAVISVISIAAIFFIVVWPFIMGIKAWFYSLSEKGEGEDISYCFFPYENHKTLLKCIGLYLCEALYKLFIYGLFTSIPLLMGYKAYGFLLSSQTPREMFISYSSLACASALLILALIFSYIFCLRLFALPYFFIENDCRSVKEAFKLSKKATDGYKGSLLLFNLSILHLYILNICPLTFLYSYPRMQSAKAIYGRILIESFYSEKRPESEENKEA